MYEPDKYFPYSPKCSHHGIVISNSMDISVPVFILQPISMLHCMNSLCEYLPTAGVSDLE